MNILHLPLKEPWYRMIQCGDKREEYREFNSYWIKRLCDIGNLDADIYANDSTFLAHEIAEGVVKFKQFTHVHFTLGYPKKDDEDRNMIFEIENISIGRGRPEWGADNETLFFVIRIKNDISKDGRIRNALQHAKFGDRFKTRGGKTALFHKVSGLLYKFWFMTDTDYYSVASSGEVDMKEINNPLDIIDICYEN